MGPPQRRSLARRTGSQVHMIKAKKISKEPKVKSTKKGAKVEETKAEKAKRRLGLRGAAPWAARHAAKHLAEARARAAVPAPPGSARSTIRSPIGAEDIKQRITDLHNALAQIKNLRKNVTKTFYDIGNILQDIQLRKLYEAKGYGTFDAFLEREIDLGKTMGLRLVRIVHTFLKDAALEYGFDRLAVALNVLDLGNDAVPAAPESKGASSTRIPPAPISTGALPLKPPGK
ncbi:MAG: hypothetical protein WCI05_09595 [Myxococcales bacterium]